MSTAIMPREDLARYIAAHAVVHEEVTLSSGQRASFYVDLRRVTLAADASPSIGAAMLQLVAELDFVAVGGLTLGADPVATSMMHAAAAQGKHLDAFVVRKDVKKHGMQQRVEGPSISGRRVLIVEDTSTTGNSALTAARAAQEAGAEVVAIAVIVDRDSGAREAIEAEGFTYLAAFTGGDLDLPAQQTV